MKEVCEKRMKKKKKSIARRERLETEREKESGFRLLLERLKRRGVIV